jgi:ATP-dependent DNA ligase
MPSICLNSTAPTSARSRLSSARQRSPIYYAVSLTASPSTGHFSGDGAMIFKHACALGCEGIVSKRLGSTYRAGRVNHWRKIKNPAAPAVKREAEEDWGGKRWTRGRRS